MTAGLQKLWNWFGMHVLRWPVPLFRKVVKTVPELRLSETQQQLSNNCSCSLSYLKHEEISSWIKSQYWAAYSESRTDQVRVKAVPWKGRTVSIKIWSQYFCSSSHASCFQDDHARKASIHSPPPLSPSDKSKLKPKMQCMPLSSVFCAREVKYILSVL